MILTDGTTTLTTENEDIQEDYISNMSTIITRGGKRIQQGDNRVLKILSRMRLTETEFITVDSILANFGAQLSYTPTRKLAGKSSISALNVVMQDWTSIKDRLWNGQIIYIVDITYLETA